MQLDELSADDAIQNADEKLNCQILPTSFAVLSDAIASSGRRRPLGAHLRSIRRSPGLWVAGRIRHDKLSELN